MVLQGWREIMATIDGAVFGHLYCTAGAVFCYTGGWANGWHFGWDYIGNRTNMHSFLPEKQWAVLRNENSGHSIMCVRENYNPELNSINNTLSAVCTN